jgi:hypothetical protein
MDRQNIAATPPMDIHDGDEWSEMDIFDLKNSLAHGNSLRRVADFLCRSGTLDDVRRKAEALGPIFRRDPITRRLPLRKGITRRPKRKAADSVGTRHEQVVVAGWATCSASPRRRAPRLNHPGRSGQRAGTNLPRNLFLRCHHESSGCHVRLSL